MGHEKSPAILSWLFKRDPFTGFINRWFSLISPAIKPVFLRRGYVRGGRFNTVDGSEIRLNS